MSEAVASDESLEAAVAAFEAARLAGEPVEIIEYLPEDLRDRARYACELVRIDLEIADTQGETRSLDDYRDSLPEVFAAPELLGEAAFEEYRLAIGRGESLTVAEQLSRYGLDRKHWPTPLENPQSAQPRYPAPGEQFDGMPLERLLGAGAFSRVYVARQPKFAMRPVALKLTAVTSVEPARLGRLQHTNIVPIYSAHYDRGLLGVAMPLLGERTFADYSGEKKPLSQAASTVRGRGEPTTVAGNTPASPGQVESGQPLERLSWRRASELVAELSLGLAHAHERGIVHGDIKPANLLMGDDGVPRLLDFNLASDASRRVPATLVVGGTLPYLAPEHLSALVEGTPVTPLCDLYSLGAVLFEMLSGRQPFPAHRGEFEDVVEAMREDRRVVPQLPPTIEASPGLRAILAKCLDPVPENRYATATAFGEELRRELADQGLRLTQEPSLGHRVAKWRRRNSGLLTRLAVVATGALALAATLMAVAWRDQTAGLTAQASLATFEAAALSARMTLGLPQLEADLRESGLQSVDRALGAVTPRGVWDRLTDIEQAQVRSTTSELLSFVDYHNGTDSLRSLAGTLPFDLEPVGGRPLVAVQGVLQTGRFSEAVRLLKAASAQEPRDPALWLQLGIAEAGAGKPNEALASLTAALALQPDAEVVRRTLAHVHQDAGRFEDALAQLSAISGEGPAEGAVQMNRAVALMGLRRHKEAESAATAAIAAGLERPRSYLLRARCREELGDSEGAQQDREAARTSSPVDDSDWAARAIALEEGSPEGALSEVRRGLEQFPRSVVLLRNELHLVGDVLKRRDEALVVARRISQTLPDDVPAKLGEAVCLASLGKYDEALTLAESISASTQRPLDRLQLGCVFALCSVDKPETLPRAVECVVGALAAEPSLALRAVRDPDLAALRRDKGYLSVVKAAATLLASSAAGSGPEASP